MPTIGVSIAVPDPCGQELQDYRIELGDESARQIPTHITLVPPYDVKDAGLSDIEAHLEKVADHSDPFKVLLRGTGTFRPISPVVFIGVVKGISGCEQLAHRLRSGPFDIDARFPYHPHVTVAHELEEPLLDKAFDELGRFECAFEVSSFWLYENDETLGWVPKREFGLSGRS